MRSTLPVPDGPSWAEALPTDGTRRFRHFASEVDRLRIDDLMLLGTRPLDGQAHRRALEDAELVAIERGRPTLVNDVRSTAGDWMLHRFTEADANPAVVGVIWTARDTTQARDRVRLATSLAEALLAIALWDHLMDEQRDELLGPWAPLAD